MRYSKGKYIFHTKETFSVDTTLNKVILGYLQKLNKCLSDSECHGVPMRYVEQQANIDGVDAYEADVDKADVLRMKDIEELIWVFSSEEPDISTYDFHINMVDDEGRDPVMEGTKPVKFVTTGLNGKDGEVEKERYHQDMLEYDKRKKEGYKLFGEIYNDLSW